MPSIQDRTKDSDRGKHSPAPDLAGVNIPTGYRYIIPPACCVPDQGIQACVRE